MRLLELLKIGQTVWSAEQGKCTVAGLTNDEDSEYPLTLTNAEGHGMAYTADGKYYPECVFPSVFLSDPSSLFGYEY
jgi:hypothetical protein